MLLNDYRQVTERFDTPHCRYAGGALFLVPDSDSGKGSGLGFNLSGSRVRDVRNAHLVDIEKYILFGNIAVLQVVHQGVLD